MTMTPGYETAWVRMDPTAGVTVAIGTSGHGQQHRTTLAQIAADELGIEPGRVEVIQGDTDATPYGWGTFASRSMVVGGGATRLAAENLAERIKHIGAHFAEAAPEDMELRDGAVVVRGSPQHAVPLEDIARVAHLEVQRLPDDVEPGLDAHASFDPPGTFSNATHGAVVEIDPETGQVRIERYVVVEDCGVMINPAVVEGQVRGGVAQGIAAALYEEVLATEDGQPQTTTLMDYLVPTAREIPAVEIEHLETPSEHSETGAKGMGEGGTMGAPGCIATAVADAVGHLGIEIDRLPITPEQLCRAIEQAPTRRRMNDEHLITVQVNGERREVAVEARRTLSDVLRHDLGYTGTHVGCEHGICGACTVLVDGAPTRACLVFGVQVDDCEVETVEGLADGEELNALQEAFAEQPRPAVRLLHPRLPHARDRAAARDPGPQRRPDPRRHGLQPVPLHGLSGDPRGRPPGGRRPGGLSGGGAPPRGRPPAARRRPLRRRRRPPGAAVAAGRARVRRARAAGRGRDRARPRAARRARRPQRRRPARPSPDPAAPRAVRGGLRPVPAASARARGVRYVGQPVAVVCAEDPYLAEDAEELVGIEYEELRAGARRARRRAASARCCAAASATSTAPSHGRRTSSRSRSRSAATARSRWRRAASSPSTTRARTASPSGA